MNSSSRFWLLLIVLNLSTMQFKAQITGFGLGVETLSSGNGHGTFFRPFVGYEQNRNFFSFGPLIHKRTSMIKGVRVGYSRNLSAEKPGTNDERLQLHLLSHVQYNESLPLSCAVEREQTLTSRVADVNFANVTLATAEIGSGIEVRINFSQAFCWRFSAGTAVSYHVKYNKALSRERLAPSLALSTGLIFFMRDSY